MEQELHSDDELAITFHIDESTDRASLLLESELGGPDLTVDDDVVVVANGGPCPVETDGPRRATADLGDWNDLSQGAGTLMVRIGEFFESWELAAGSA